MNDRWDVILVGGGIVGAVCAHRLRERSPQARILLLDGLRVGLGASAYSLGVATHLARTKRIRRLSQAGHNFYRTRRGAGWPVRDLTIDYLTRNEAGPPVTGMMLRNERLELPADVPGPWLAFRNDRPALIADVKALCRMLLAECLRPPHGAVWEAVAARGLQSEGEGVRLELCDGRVLHAAKVLLCTGPWLPQLLGESLTETWGLQTKRIVSLQIGRKPAPGSRTVYFCDAGAFAIPDEAGARWLFSFSREAWNELPIHERMALSGDDIEQGRAVLSELAPHWGENIAGGRVFCDLYGPNREPLVAAHPQIPGVHALAAGSGSGFRLAPGMADEYLDQDKT